jgi:hypothetical protein
MVAHTAVVLAVTTVVVLASSCYKVLFETPKVRLSG